MKNFFSFFSLILFGILLLLYFGALKIQTEPTQDKVEYRYILNGYIATEFNYRERVRHLAEQYGISPYYLKALILLETSGKLDNQSRFEPAVFSKLQALQKEEIQQFENLEPKDVKNLDNEMLQLMSTSWGPLQIMGYKHIFLGISLDELKGANSLEHGVEWIDRTYGTVLRQKKFKDAFHIHNTGRVFPENGKTQTFDPEYVSKGLEYMQIFELSDTQALPWIIVKISD